ncbi:hypothetical protein X975_05036, partial [Stegodyphus mimosarum]
MAFNEPIYNEALIIIENKVLTMVGKKLQDFGMFSSRRSDENFFNDEIARELAYNFIALQQQVAELVPQLLPEQSHVFHQVLRKTESGNGAPLFLDAPGGIGKTFLLNLLRMSIRKDQKIAVAVAFPGIAATLLNSDRTAHSVLNLPLNLAQEDSPIWNFSKNSSRSRMLRQSMEDIIHTVENRVGEIEESISEVQQQIDGRVSALVAKEVDTLKNCTVTTGNNFDGFKFLPMPAHPSLKLSTYDGKASWQAYKTQFSVVTEVNR